MEIRLEDTKLGQQTIVKTYAAINTTNVDKLNYLDEKLLCIKRRKTEKLEEDWGVETELKENGTSGDYKNINGAEASTWGFLLPM